MLKYILVFIALFILEIIYIKIAFAKNIKDNPNHRSAHTKPTIRGGGIIVVFAILIYAIIYTPEINFYYFLIGVLLVSIISFLDDLITLSSVLRLGIHITAFSLVFYSLGLFQINTLAAVTLVVFSYIFSIGYLNIYNFMDGINGITFLNALVSYFTLLYLNEYYLVFEDSSLFILLIISIVVFGFFNFRKKAICFAGDIGSISIGFSLLYFVLKFYIKTNNPLILLLFSVYLLDGGWTILERLLRKENIFIAHKRHLYQILVNDFKMSHIKISTFYFIIQLIVNMIMIFLILKDYNGITYLVLIFGGFSIFYFFIKLRYISKLNP